jgi:hypothetical protein
MAFDKELWADLDTKLAEVSHPVGSYLDQEWHAQTEQIRNAPLTGEDDPQGVLGRVVDVLSRGQYMAAGFAGEILTNKLFTQPAAVIGDAATTAVREFFNPQARLSFSDVLADKAPKFAHENPIATGVLGFVGDVALDPLTWVSLGTAVGAKVTVKGAAVGAARRGLLKGAKGVKGGAGVGTLSRQGRKVLSEFTDEAGRIAGKNPSNQALTDAREKIAAHYRTRKGYDVGSAFHLAEQQLEVVAKAVQKGNVDAGLKFAKKHGLDLDKADYFALGQGASLQSMSEQGMKKVSQLIADDLMEKGTSELLDQGGIKFARRQIVSGEKIDKLSNALGISQFKRWVGQGIAESKMGRAFQAGFDRAGSVPAEIVGMERRFFARLEEGSRRMRHGFKALHGGMKKESRYAVGVSMAHLDDMEQEIVKGIKEARAGVRKTEDMARWFNGEEMNEFLELKAVNDAYNQANGTFRTLVVPKQFIEGVVGRNTAKFLASPSLQKEAMEKTVLWASDRGTKEAKAIQKMFAKRGTQGLDDAEKSMLGMFRDEMNRLGKIEMEGKILKGMKKNYYPRYYDMARDPRKFTTMLSKTRGNLVTKFTPNETRKFKTLSDAVDAGFDPIYDLSTLYAMRVTDHYEQLAKVEFADSLISLVPELKGKLGKFGAKVKDEMISTTLFDGSHLSIRKAAEKMVASGDQATVEMGKILERVRFIGNPMYDPLDTVMKNDVLKKYDKALSFFRSSATVLRPAFSARNAVSNQFQMFLGGGMDAMRHAKVFFDPRTALDAVLLQMAHSRPELLAKMRPLKSVFGARYSPEQVLQASKDYNIVRNAAVEGVGATPVNSVKTVRKLTRELDRATTVKRGLFRGVDNVGTDGASKLFTGSLNYWDVPALIEDHSRLTMFANMMRSGYDPKTAAEFVERSLFDYSNGLSQFEQRVMRRIVPFYSFQRFAIPLVTRMTGRSLGRVPNTAKAGKVLMETWGKIQRGDQELSRAERAAVPGFLIEQPHTFAGFDQDMKATFNVFNNFTPLDVLGFVEADEKTGGIDFHKSVINGALAQLTPMLKIPLEMALDKNLFTGRVLSEASKQGDLDVDQLFANLAATATAQTTQRFGGSMGTAGVIAARQFAEKFSQMAPDAAVTTLKALLGYEEGIDPRTGEKTVYMSPYRLHALTSIFPGMNEAIRGARTDKTATEKAYRFMFGVSVQKRDLAKDASTNAHFKRVQKGQLKGEVRKAMRQGRDKEAQKKLAEYQNFLRNWAGETEALSSGPIRSPEAQGMNINDVVGGF